MIANVKLRPNELREGDLMRDGREIESILPRTMSFILCFTDGSQGRVDRDQSIFVQRPGVIAC